MTPRELMFVCEAYQRRTLQEMERNLFQAYMSAVWHRAKRLPKWQDVKKRLKPLKPQTPEEMLHEVKRLHAALESKEG